MSHQPHVKSQVDSPTPVQPQQAILYLCSAFPVVSETFISNQVEACLAKGSDVKVLALLPGNNPVLSQQWLSVPQHAGVLQVLYPRGMGVAQVLVTLPLTFVRVALRPSSWALTLHCMRTAPELFAQASLFAGWLRHNPQHADTLVCHFGTVGYIGALLRAWGYLHMPQVTVFHGFDMSSIIKRKGYAFYTRLFRTFRHASVPITRFWQKILTEMGDAKPAWIPLGVNTGYVQFNPRSYPQGRPVRFITVGRLTSKKGQMDVLKALANLPQEHAWASNWEYHLIGAGPEENELKAVSEQLGFGTKVVFHGALPHNQTLQHLAEADVFVLTSRMGKDGDMEGLPVALMEALASGMPTLSTYHSGIPELITHQESGLLSPEGDIEALSANLGNILSQPEIWHPLTQAGRSKVENDYDSAKNFEKFWTFLQNHMNEHLETR